MMDPQALLKMARDFAGNPMMVLAAASKFLTDYCDDHGVDRDVLCRMIREQPRKPIDVG